jgi:hypothetical protein
MIAAVVINVLPIARLFWCDIAKIAHLFLPGVKVRLNLVNKKLKRISTLFICIFLRHEQEEIHRTHSAYGSIRNSHCMGSGDLDQQLRQGAE